MVKEKKHPHKVVMTEGKRDIIRGLIAEYNSEKDKTYLTLTTRTIDTN